MFCEQHCVLRGCYLGLAHGFFSVPRGEVERCPWVVEVVQPDPDYFVFILKEFIDHGRVVSVILFWYHLRPLVGVPEGLDALQDFVLHLEFVEVRLEWVKRGNAGDVFLGPRGVWRGSPLACWIPFCIV